MGHEQNTNEDPVNPKKDDTTENETHDDRWRRFARHLNASSGYAELGMKKESIAELNEIPEHYQNSPEVLQLRLHHLMRSKKWTAALRISQQLCRLAPDAGAGFIHSSFCLHKLNKTGEALEVIRNGPPALEKDPIYFYNRACYEALLGHINEAVEHLEKSFEMNENLREPAKKDPDLKSVHHLI